MQEIKESRHPIRRRLSATSVERCLSSTTLNAVTESGEFKSYVRAAESRRTSGEIEINKRQHMEGKIVLAVTDSRANYLVIDGSVSVNDFVNKVKDVLYEYRYVDDIYRDMVTMDVVRANLGRLYTKEDSTNEEETFTYVAIITIVLFECYDI